MTPLDNSSNTFLHDFLGGLVEFEDGHIPGPNTPPEGVYPKGLTIKNIGGETPVHSAAHAGHLDWIPTSLITKEAITTADNDGRTPMHNAARSGHLNQMPIELLTEETLSTINNEGYTPLAEASAHNHLDQLLGIKFSNEIIQDVGPEWYEKNENILKQQESVGEQEAETAEIELF